MDDVLARIYADKAEVLARDMARESYEVVRERAHASIATRRPFLAALRRQAGASIVAEIKRASPSAGLIARAFDPVAIARRYTQAGADAISVLTETEHFLGDLGYLQAVRDVTHLPLLRKDFLSAPYQVAQSAAYGADCILLIVAGLDDATLSSCMNEARIYDLDVLVEVHDRDELERAVRVGATLIGVNNRNLRTMTTDLATSEHLIPLMPQGVFAISESGMRSIDDLRRLRQVGAQGFLVGEALMRSGDPVALIGTLKS